jgi:primosomal protein N' (replication factor Y)
VTPGPTNPFGGPGRGAAPPRPGTEPPRQAALWSEPAPTPPPAAPLFKPDDRFGQIAVDLTAEGTDKLFTYLIPLALAPKLFPGQWVRVPFGPRYLAGLYLGEVSQPPEGVKLKPISGLLPELPPVPARLIELARWTADRYLSTFPAALRLLVPAEARKEQVRTQRVLRLILKGTPVEALATAEAIERRAPKQALVLRLIAEAGGQLPQPELLKMAGDGLHPAIRSLLQKGLLDSTLEDRRRDPFGGEKVEQEDPPELTREQIAALSAVQQELTAPVGFRQPILLHGVTGAGKTELYLRSIALVAEKGKQAICLVPEIALTPQMIHRFRARFGKAVAVLHSALSAGERFDEWQRIRRGEVSIVVGARSAVFAPFENVGLIIIDEEHESSYKQESPAPAYHAREVAIERARLDDALLILGSATPALESYQLASSGHYRLVEMTMRIDDRPLPPVTLIDMREELRAGNRSIFSEGLHAALERCIQAGNQAMLFLNRRGYNTFILCRDCGEAIQCPNCAVAMTYHLGDRHLTCHYCDHAAPLPTTCPNCISKRIKPMGAGTERVEEELKALYPHLRIARMDVDTTRRKGAHAQILGAFGRREVDVLIGTQMIAKGLDFPDVTLVGIILADTTLNLPDFRAKERTFQLITQMAGRAGRGTKLGEVMVQTYQPESTALQAAQHHDFISFFEEEIETRQQMGYPPFTHLVRLLVTGDTEAETQGATQALANLLQAGGVTGRILPPSAAPLVKIKNRYRYHLILYGSDVAKLTTEIRAAFAKGRWTRPKSVNLTVDVDPLSIL